jgi:hypothetical protein
MVHFEPAKVPRLRLPSGERGLQRSHETRKLPFDAMALTAMLLHVIAYFRTLTQGWL